MDAIRGLALFAMVVFHGAWDLSNADLIGVDVSNHPGWQWFARGIAASFLAIVGVSLVLANGTKSRTEASGRLNRQRFLWRWLLLAGAAALVTIGTMIMFPESFVFFGILHHIALASLVALPFLALPLVLTLLAGIFAFALPFVLRSSVFDPSWLIWTGLAQKVPDSVDFVPFLPWFGFVLVGVALGRIGRDWLQSQGWQAQNPLSRLATMAGRHSLVIYLVHQPILLGLIWLFQSVTPLVAADAFQRFDTDCRKSCVTQNAEASFCAKACGCTVAAARRNASLEAAFRAGVLDKIQNASLADIAQICAREMGGDSPTGGHSTKP